MKLIRLDEGDEIAAISQIEDQEEPVEEITADETAENSEVIESTDTPTENGENNQTENGINIPKVLVPYTGFETIN